MEETDGWLLDFFEYEFDRDVYIVVLEQERDNPAWIGCLLCNWEEKYPPKPDWNEVQSHFVKNHEDILNLVALSGKFDNV